jgi:hypothetical protein
MRPFRRGDIVTDSNYGEVRFIVVYPDGDAAFSRPNKGLMFATRDDGIGHKGVENLTVAWPISNGWFIRSERCRLIKAAQPISALEADLERYIAAEFKELGL